MREIKFKFYNKKTGKLWEECDMWWNYTEFLNKDEVIVCQFTGLFDRNGQEIYEGDVVSLDENITADNSMGILPNGWTFSKEDVYEVIWDDERAAWTLKIDAKPDEKVLEEFGEYANAYMQKYLNHVRGLLLQNKAKIVGNIYEYSKLLNKQSE